jgi:hypothetical protein
MTVDAFDVAWFLSMLGFGVMLGVSAENLWFGAFGMVMTHWFIGRMVERWLNNKADRNHAAWRKSVGLD